MRREPGGGVAVAIVTSRAPGRWVVDHNANLMIVTGQILLAVGLVVALIGNVMFLTVAFRRSLWWFFGCLFIPLVDIVFLFLNWKATAKPFGIGLLGLILAGVGAGMAGVDWPS